jgi:hypothetical protein
MLYHPCANLEEVEKLRQIVTKCNSRHIITAHNHLPMERVRFFLVQMIHYFYKICYTQPLALLGYGCRLYMAQVDQTKVVEFVKTHAMRAPENQETSEGQYDHMLVKSALDLKQNLKHNITKWCAAYE